MLQRPKGTCAQDPKDPNTLDHQYGPETNVFLYASQHDFKSVGLKAHCFWCPSLLSSVCRWFCMSTKQKINTGSSTEAELVGVDDGMPMVLWSRQFLMAQGYNVSDNVVYQDNQSAILLERNGRASSGRRTRHIDIRYFFATDRIAKGELRVQYCPTDNMVADFLTKPLQGSLFRKFRAMMLNLPDETINPLDTGSQECVGKPSVGKPWKPPCTIAGRTTDVQTAPAPLARLTSVDGKWWSPWGSHCCSRI